MTQPVPPGPSASSSAGRLPLYVVGSTEVGEARHALPLSGRSTRPIRDVQPCRSAGTPWGTACAWCTSSPAAPHGTTESLSPIRAAVPWVVKGSWVVCRQAGQGDHNADPVSVGAWPRGHGPLTAIAATVDRRRPPRMSPDDQTPSASPRCPWRPTRSQHAGTVAPCSCLRPTPATSARPRASTPRLAVEHPGVGRHLGGGPARARPEHRTQCDRSATG